MEPGPQFRQLAMFMTASELTDDHSKVVPGDFTPDRAAEGWAQKLHEAKTAAPGKHGHVEYGDGIRNPVSLQYWSDRGTIGNGHHRVAVARDRGPNTLVPVEHHDPDSIQWERQARRAKQNADISRWNAGLRSDGSRR